MFCWSGNTDTGRVRYVPSNDKILIVLGWFVGSSDVSQKFRRSGVPAYVGSSDVSRLTDLEGSLSWSYRTCPVCTTKSQRLVFKSLEGREFRREEVPACVGSFDTSYSLTQLHGFQIC